MKDCIFVGSLWAASNSWLTDDLISGKIHINAKKAGQHPGSKMDFIIYRNGTDHAVQCIWYSNIIKTVQRTYTLKEYSPEKYHKYIDTEIVNVDCINDIPDYDGIMGVPTSILKFYQDQFEIFGKAPTTTIEVDGKRIDKFDRILIKKKLKEKRCTVQEHQFH